jgi:hypothetical protein
MRRTVLLPGAGEAPRSALIDANYQIEGPEKHQKSSGLLASLMVTLFTVWV